MNPVITEEVHFNNSTGVPSYNEYVVQLMFDFFFYSYTKLRLKFCHVQIVIPC